MLAHIYRRFLNASSRLLLNFSYFPEIDVRGLKIKLFHIIVFICTLTFMQFNYEYYRIKEEREEADWRVRKKCYLQNLELKETIGYLCLH